MLKSHTGPRISRQSSQRRFSATVPVVILSSRGESIFLFRWDGGKKTNMLPGDRGFEYLLESSNCSSQFHALSVGNIIE